MLTLGENRKNEFWSSLALKHCSGIGILTAARLLRHYGSAYDAYKARKSWIGSGFSKKICEAIQGDSWRAAALNEWKAALSAQCGILLWTDVAYPGLLREIPDPPLFIYYQGDLSLLNSPGLAIVGSRNASAYALDLAAYMAKSLSGCGITIISGLAMGIDAAAHEAALLGAGKSIGVLGTGIDLVYPPMHRKLFESMRSKGLIVSELAPGTPPLAAHFPVRNRIISGLALGVLVVEAASRSGTLITARMALEQNREVFAMPGRALDTRCYGCHNLIREGARPVFCADDILADLSHQLKNFGIFPSSPESLENGIHSHVEAKTFSLNVSPVIEPGHTIKSASQSGRSGELSEIDLVELEKLPAEEKIIMYLKIKGCAVADELVAKLSESPQIINATLLLLEMSGRVHRLAGANYELCI